MCGRGIVGVFGDGVGDNVAGEGRSPLEIPALRRNGPRGEWCVCDFGDDLGDNWAIVRRGVAAFID